MTSVRLRLSALHRSERGSAIVELAVTLPLVVLLAVGVADFARVFYVSIALTNAARAGAQYGSQNLKYTDRPNMVTTATSAAGTVPMTAAASYRCRCAGDDGTPTETFALNTCPPTCTNPLLDHLVIQVTVETTSTFNTITQFPGIPHSLTMTRSATLRAQ